MWQYIHGTPLGQVVAQADDPHRAALEHGVCEGWRDLMVDGTLTISMFPSPADR